MDAEFIVLFNDFERAKYKMGKILKMGKNAKEGPHMQNSLVNKYTLLDGLAYNTRGYFASCVVFFRAPQGRGKMRAMSKMSASIIC